VVSNRKLGNINSSYHHHLAFSPVLIQGRGDTKHTITDPVAPPREPSELRRPVSLTYWLSVEPVDIEQNRGLLGNRTDKCAISQSATYLKMNMRWDGSIV